MFMAIWAAWCKVRDGLTHALPSSWAEVLRQPLFGNRNLRDTEGNMLGTHSHTKLGLWSKRGFSHIADIWDPERPFDLYQAGTKVYRVYQPGGRLG